MNKQEEPSIYAIKTKEKLDPNKIKHDDLEINTTRDHIFEEFKNLEDSCNFYEEIEPIEESDIRNIAVRQKTIRESQELIISKERSEVLAIGDLDADLESFIEIMSLAGYVKTKNTPNSNKKSVHLKKKALTNKIIQTGDFFDRGRHLLKLIEYVNALQKNNVDIKLIAGNHEILALYTLTCSSVINSDPKFYKLIKKIQTETKSLKNQELYKLTNKILEEDIQKNWDSEPQVLHLDVLNFINWYHEGGKNILEEVESLNKFKRRYKSQNSIKNNLEKTRKLLLKNKNYADIIKNLSIIEEIDDVLYLHGGISDFWADLIKEKGIKKINQEFREDIKNNNLAKYVVGEEQEIFWKRRDVLTPYSARIIKELGYTTIVRGHDITYSGEPEAHNEFGINIINIDTGIKLGKLGGIEIDKNNEVKSITNNTKKHLITLPQLIQTKLQESIPQNKSA